MATKGECRPKTVQSDKTWTVRGLLNLLDQGRLSLSVNTKKGNPQRSSEAWLAAGAWRRPKLVDSVLRGIYPSNFQLRKVGKKYEMLDGQQRLVALRDFLLNMFRLPSDAATVDGVAVAGKYFGQLPKPTQREILDRVVLVWVCECDDETAVEIFLRANEGGVGLNGGEIRHSMLTSIGHRAEGIALHHPFLQVVTVPEARRGKETLVGTLLILQKAGKPTRVISEDVRTLYREYDDKIGEAEEFVVAPTIKVLDVLGRAFTERSAKLTGTAVRGLFLVVSRLLREGWQIEGRENEIREWFYPLCDETAAKRRLAREGRVDGMDPMWQRFLYNSFGYDGVTRTGLRCRFDLMWWHFLQHGPRFSKPSK